MTESTVTSSYSIENSQSAPDTLPLKGWKYTPTTVKFDPAKHLAIEEPAWIKKMSDFGFDNKKDAISEVAVTAPFRIFTEEAIRLMRNDLLSAPVQENCVYSWERAPYTVRGFAPKYSQFIYDALTHPLVMEAISRAAGIDLVQGLDYEVGHTNIQLGAKGAEGVRDLSCIPAAPLPESERLPPSAFDDRPIDDWHHDCMPFVAVLMLSDTTGMLGGETAIRAKDGSTHVVPGPALGKVVVMQGQKLLHAALRSVNCPERIAFATSLRPRDPMVPDASTLRNMVKQSNLAELRSQYSKYRLENLQQRFQVMRSKFDERDVDADEVINFAEDQIAWLETTINELRRT